MTAAQGGRISRVRANPHVIVTFSGAVRLHYRILLYFLDMKVGLLYNFFKHIHYFLCIFMARENVYPDTSAADRGVSPVLESRDACVTEAYKGVLQECIVLWQICRAIPARDTRSFFNLLCDSEGEKHG